MDTTPNASTHEHHDKHYRHLHKEATMELKRVTGVEVNDCVDLRNALAKALRGSANGAADAILAAIAWKHSHHELIEHQDQGE